MYVIVKLESNLPKFLGEKNAWVDGPDRAMLIGGNHIAPELEHNHLLIDYKLVMNKSAFTSKFTPYQFKATHSGDRIRLSNHNSIETITGDYLMLAKSPNDLYLPQNIAILRAFFNRQINESFSPVVDRLLSLIRRLPCNQEAA